MSETALQSEQEPSGVPPGEFSDDLAGPHPLDPRQAVVEEVANARREELRQDGFDIPPEDAGEAEAEDGETPPPEPEGDGREPLPGEPLYTVTVDGEERQVPLSEITASYQIQDAARNRLAQANEVLRQARIQQGTPAPDATPDAQPATEQPADPLSEIDWGDLAEKLQYGDKDAAAAALKDTVTRIVETGGGAPGGAAATPEQVELRVLEKIEWTTAVNRFGEDYQDILKDPHVGGIAGSIARTLYQQAMQDAQMNGQPRRPYWDIFREAGEKTREWRNGLAGQEEADPSRPANNLSPERGQRKRAAPQPATPRSGMARSGARRDKAPKSDTQRYSEGIADIQRARGQR